MSLEVELTFNSDITRLPDHTTKKAGKLASMTTKLFLKNVVHFNLASIYSNRNRLPIWLKCPVVYGYG